jgi:replication factor A1
VTDINENLAPHIEDLKRALGESVPEDKIVEELKKFFEYGVTPQEAKKAVVKKLGGDLNSLFESVSKTLDQVHPTDRNLDLKVKIVAINPKTVTVQGSDKEIFYGLIADQTMVRPFTAWNDFNLSKNDVIHIRSAYAKDWRGEPQINLGNSTSIEVFSDPDLEAITGSNLPTSLPTTDYEIASIRDGLSNITVTGRVLSLEPRTVTVNDENKEIFTGILADETGKIAFTAWSDFSLKPGEIIKISGAYIRSWRGVPKLNFDERMELTRLPNDSLPDVDELNLDKIARLDKVLEMGGAMDITIEGTFLDIKEGSGLITRCAECNRVLRNSECMVHGTQTGVPDLRVKGVVDDGADSVMVVLNSELTSRILGMSVDEVKQKIEDDGVEYLEKIFDELSQKLLLNPMRFKGTITTDEYGAMMICSDIDSLVISEEVQIRAKDLLENINADTMSLGGD